MKVELKFISTRSGKSMVLKIEAKTYIFNIFEGFQRYAIEMKLSLTQISAVFLADTYNVPPLIAICLTHLESPHVNMNVVSNLNLNSDVLLDLGYSFSSITNFEKSFSDKYITVKLLNSNETSNFVISFAKIRGTFRHEQVPQQIPKKLYSRFLANGFLEYEGITYKLDDYSEPALILNDVCLIFNQTNLEDLPQGLKCFFCFNYTAYLFLCRRYPHLKCTSEDSFVNLEGIYYITDNKSIEYDGFYKKQVQYNLVDSRYIVPYNFNEPNIHDIHSLINSLEAENVLKSKGILETGDALSYFKTTGFNLIKKLQSSPDLPTERHFKLPAIHFLGTGCAIPSKYRNVSAILYENSTSAILLDSGEDTYSQIERLYGDFKILEKLEIIFISHSHADHVLGIAKVLRACKKHVYVVASDDVKSYLRYFGYTFDVIDNCFNYKSHNETALHQRKSNITFISTTPTKIKSLEYYKNLNEKDIGVDRFIDTFVINNFSVKICGCIHSKTSVSISITDQSTNKTFSYSGDTVPSELFAHISRDNDLMIHEATFNKGQEIQASKTFHSVKEKAIEIFKLSKAKKLLFTHFSNRNQDEACENDKQSEIECVGDFFQYDFT